MSLGHGASVVRNGLVFHYDMNNDKKSWKGKPTTNLWATQANVSDLNRFNNWQMPGVPGAVSAITTDYGTWNGATKSSIWKVTVGTGTMQSYASWRLCLDTGLSSLGSTRRLQAKVKMLRGSITDLGFHNGGGTGSWTYTAIDPADIPGGISNKTDWYLLSMQSNWSSTTVGQCIGIGILSQDIEFLVAEPMVALDATSTVPYTPNARSNTEALIDLTGNQTITANSLVYNSDGTFSFNGSSDYITTGFTRGTLGNMLTMFAWYKYTGTSGRGYTPIFGGLEPGTGTEFFIGKNTGNTNIGLQDGNYNGSFVTGSNAFDGNWHNIAYTYDNGTGKIYLDGILKNTGSFTKCNDAEQIVIGYESEGAGYYFLGNISNVSIYNRALSANEVKQNFNATRGRYGI